MAIQYSVTAHARAELGNLIAEDYGEHIVSLDIAAATDNGLFAKVKKMKSLDLWDYELANTSQNVTFSAYIVDQSKTSDLWLVVIDDVSDFNDHLAFIYQKPLIAEESPYALTKEKNFYNDPQDGPVRGHIVHALDRVWLSADAFGGNKAPTKGATISSIVNGKPVVD